jgi:hypothetical protein
MRRWFLLYNNKDGDVRNVGLLESGKVKVFFDDLQLSNVRLQLKLYGISYRRSLIVGLLKDMVGGYYKSILES